MEKEKKKKTGLFHGCCQLLVSPERIPGGDSYKEQIMLVNAHTVLARIFPIILKKYNTGKFF